MRPNEGCPYLTLRRRETPGVLPRSSCWYTPRAHDKKRNVQRHNNGTTLSHQLSSSHYVTTGVTLPHLSPIPQARGERAKFCSQCLILHYYSDYRLSTAQQLLCKWPQLFCDKLKSDNADATWRLLPPSIRQMWTGKFPTLRMDAPGPADGYLHNPVPLTRVQFMQEAARPWDTLCGVCRTLLVNGEHEVLPLANFREWLDGHG